MDSNDSAHETHSLQQEKTQVIAEPKKMFYSRLRNQP